MDRSEEPSKSFKDLQVWQKSMDLAKEVYVVAGELPRHELYSLGDQIRRCAVSIPSNIAEGSRRHSSKEFHQFIGISRGSAAELETQLILAASLYSDVSVERALHLLVQVQKMLTRLSQTLRAKL